MKVLEEQQLREMVGEREALEAVELAFTALAEGTVVQPPPMGLDLPEAQGEVHVKGACIQGEPVFAIKVASGFYRNPEKGLPSGSGIVLVFDAGTGFPLALFRDNGYLTELRTGGAGALAVRLLAPDRPLRTAVVGAGSQARYQIRAISRIRPLDNLRVWSPVPAEVEVYVEEMATLLGIPVEGASSPREVVDGADLVVTVTPSRTPLLQDGWLAPGATVVAVGADGPEKRELSTGVLATADKIVVDSRDQCLRLGEAHHAVVEGVLAPGAIHAELGEVLVGGRPGREGEETIVVDLTGVGAQDAALAGVVWRMVSEG